MRSSRQAQLRGITRDEGGSPRTSAQADNVAHLAARLTDRDRWLLAMLHEHRVLTTHQIAALAFTCPRAAQHRLQVLHRYSALDRFRPLTSLGSAPAHYVLGPAGATVLAAQHGLTVRELGYSRERARGQAHSMQLAHTLGLNHLCTRLARHARHAPDLRLTAWWSETRCARYYGDLVRPDAYLQLQHHDTRVEGFVEYDTGSENLAQVAAKLHGYHQLATATGITTPVLYWLPTSARETHARRALAHTHSSLARPDRVPVATATSDQPTQHTDNPAHALWLPLADPSRRRALTDLWPTTTPTPGTTTPAPPESLLPAPTPHPPAPHTHRRAGG